MGVLAHERFGKLTCGKCPVQFRSMVGCPYPVRDEGEAKELGGTYEPADRSTWQTFTFRFPRKAAAWTSQGCPWPQFVEHPVLDRWVSAWELLKRFGKTPVDLGVWPKVTSQYLDLMLHLDRLSDEMESMRLEREEERMKRERQARGW